jgi:hypothetical protein
MDKEIPCHLSNNELSLAMGINLQVEIHDVMFRIPATIVGFIPDQCILVTIPLAERKRVASKIYAGSKIVVRYIHEGSVFGFESEFLGDITTPVALQIIAYPVFVAHRSLRSGKRVDCFLPGQLTAPELTYPGVVLNISETGCLFSIDGHDLSVQAQIGDTFDLQMQLPGCSEEHSIPVVFRSIKHYKRGTRLGLQFAPCTAETRDAIRGCVAFLESFMQEQVKIA